MPKTPAPPFLRPLTGDLGAEGSGTIERAVALLAKSRQNIAELENRLATMVTLPNSDNLTPDHPYSRLFGFERARLLLGAETEQMKKAAERRETVRRLSLDKQKVRDIATQVGCSTGNVVKIRARLRREGKLPRL